MAITLIDLIVALRPQGLQDQSATGAGSVTDPTLSFLDVLTEEQSRLATALGDQSSSAQSEITEVDVSPVEGADTSEAPSEEPPAGETDSPATAGQGSTAVAVLLAAVTAVPNTIVQGSVDDGGGGGASAESTAPSGASQSPLPPETPAGATLENGAQQKGAGDAEKAGSELVQAGSDSEVPQPQAPAGSGEPVDKAAASERGIRQSQETSSNSLTRGNAARPSRSTVGLDKLSEGTAAPPGSASAERVSPEYELYRRDAFRSNVTALVLESPANPELRSGQVHESRSVAELLTPGSAVTDPTSAGSTIQNGANTAHAISVLGHGRAGGTQGLNTDALALQQTGSVPAPEPVSLKSLSEQTLRSVRLLLSKNERTLTVRLVPESLGEMHVEVHSSGETMTVRLTSANAAVRQTLETQVQQLRDSLSRDGLNVSRVDISANLASGAGAGQSGGRDTAENMQPTPRPFVTYAQANTGNSPDTPVSAVRRPTHHGLVNLFV